MFDLWLFFGAELRTLPLTIQRHILHTAFVLIAGSRFGWCESECTVDGFTGYPFKANSEKGPDLGLSLVMMPFVTLAPLIFAEPLYSDIVVLILDFLGVLLSGLMIYTLVVHALSDHFAMNPRMLLGSMLATSYPVFGARRRKSVRRGPQADHGSPCFSCHACGADFEDETIDAGEFVSYAAMTILGAATLGLCFFFSKRQCSWVPPPLSPSSRLALGLCSSTTFSCGVMSTRPAPLGGSGSSTWSKPLLIRFRES